MSANKYTEGDQVRIRRDLEFGVKYDGLWVSKEMEDLAGSIQTIEEVVDDRYNLKGDQWFWSDEMFEPFVLSSPKFKEGDQVRVREGLQIGKLYDGIEYLDAMDDLIGFPLKISEVYPPDDESPSFTYLAGAYWYSGSMLVPAKPENDPVKTENDPVKTKNDPIDPDHYRYGQIECIDAIETVVAQYPDQVSAFLAGQVIKYIWRAPLKHAYLQDLKKIRWYLNRLIDHAEKKEASNES